MANNAGNNNTNLILDDAYRKNFIKTANYKDLNDYLKYMERLAKKGGVYKTLYDKDIEFMCTMNDTDQDDQLSEQFVCSMIGKTFVKKDDSVPTQSEQYYDTEAYVNKLTAITQTSMKSKNPIETEYADELTKIKIILYNEHNNKNKMLNGVSGNVEWAKAIRKFIDLVTTSNDELKYFRELSKLITKNQKFLKESFHYLGKLLKNDKSKLSEEFMKKYSDMRKIKHTKSKSEYNKIKDIMIKDYIIKLGCCKVYSSKFVEKVIYAYRTANNATKTS